MENDVAAGLLVVKGGLWHRVFGEAEAIADLIPFMLAAFLESDRGFAKAVKEGQAVPVLTEEKTVRRQPRKQVEAATLSSPASNNEEPTP